MTSSARPADFGRLADDNCGRDWIWDREVETASRSQQFDMANRAWKEQAARLEERSPFYRRRFASAGVGAADIESVLHLARLPTMTKDDIHQSQAADPPFGGHLGGNPDDIKRVFQTSGTSGRPSAIALTAADIETWTTIGARSYYATGIHAHHSVLTTYGAGPFVAGHIHSTLDRIGVRRVPVGPGDTARVMSALELGLVDTLIATPSFAIHLASVFKDRTLHGHSLGVRHLVVGGEPGGGIPAVKARIEAAFGAAVTEAAGIGDVCPSLYGECPVQDGMHFCGQGLVWVELLDPESGAPLTIEKGAVGELVYTTLVRDAMPVIRFRSGDAVEITDTRCPCDRTSFKIRIKGRTDNMFIVRGVNVYPSAIQAIVAEFEPRVTGRSRVVLPEGAGVSIEPPVPVEVEVPDSAAPGMEVSEAIAAAIRARLVFRATVEFVPQSRFGDPGYKTPPVVRWPMEHRAP